MGHEVPPWALRGLLGSGVQLHAQGVDRRSAHRAPARRPVLVPHRTRDLEERRMHAADADYGTPEEETSDTEAARLRSELDELVAATEGLQPWRRVFHAANGSVMVGLLATATLTREQLLVIVALALLGALAIDVLRLRVTAVQHLFFRFLSSLASPREAVGIASSTWYLAGVLVALLAFPLDVAMASILVLALGDPAASYVGRRWGRHRVPGDGSVEGTAVFWFVSLVVLLAFFPPHHAILGSLVATVVERIPWPLDDNFTLPVGTGLALVLIGSALTAS